MKFRRISAPLSVFVAFAMMHSSCSEPSPDKTTEPEKKIEVQQNDNAVAGNMVKVEGELFSIPSPVQTAILFKKMKVPYNTTILNSEGNAANYLSRYEQALNLGVYGADLAYLSNYDDNQTKINYFKVINDLTQELNISNSIDQNLIDRFASNADNPDSLHMINAEVFKAGDRYLKENQENETAKLILVGGWVEALHIAITAAKQNPDFMDRVGEQKSALNSVVNLMKKVENPSSKELINELDGLKSIYDGMEMTYEYVKPITDANEKVTYINSRSNVEMDESKFAEIETQVSKIRQLIIQ